MKTLKRIMKWVFACAMVTLFALIIFTGLVPKAGLVGGVIAVFLVWVEGGIHEWREKRKAPDFKYEYPTPSESSVISALQNDLEVTEFWYKAVIKQLEEDVHQWKIIADTNSIFGVSATDRERQLAVMLQDARDMIAELMPKGDERDDEYLGYIDEKLAVYKHIKQLEESRLSDVK